MDYRFSATEWKRLSAIERAHRCRSMSEEAMTMAEHAAPELTVRYLELAEAFLKLALDLDAKAKISRG